MKIEDTQDEHNTLIHVDTEKCGDEQRGYREDEHIAQHVDTRGYREVWGRATWIDTTQSTHIYRVHFYPF